MKKKILILVVFCSMLLFFPKNVLAHPGKTDGNGCHYCRTNCSKWGLNNDEYHCHNGNTYTNSKGQTYNSNGTLISEGSSSNSNNTGSGNSNSNNNVIPSSKPKSSDNTLKSISIDGQDISVSDTMTYKTKKDKIDIVIELNDSKATYDINNKPLLVGKNDISIKVTAENGDVKNYSLLVNRENLSSNTNVKIIVDDKEVNFFLEKANIDVSSDTENLNYKYELEDKNSQIKINGDKDLKAGENIVTFIVTAEDGTEKEYKLTVNKYTKTDEVMGAILGMATMGGIGYGIYYFVKKKKKK